MAADAAPERIDDWLGATLIAMARPLLPAAPRLPEAERRVVEADVTAHLRFQVRAMPTHLRIPLVAALLFFDAWPRLHSGRAFRKIAPHAQAAILQRWSRSRIPQFRDLVKLVRSCALFAYLDHPVVGHHLDEATAAAKASHGGAGAAR